MTSSPAVDRRASPGPRRPATPPPPPIVSTSIPAVVAALCCAWCAAALAAAPVGRYTRSIAVERAGEVVVPLDLAVITRMAPEAADLRLRAPDGSTVPIRLLSLEDGEARREARAEAVEPAEEGWWLRIDAGAGSRRHQRLRFDFVRRTLAPGVTLESSADGERWRRLASSDLFRLGDDPASERIALDYEPTGDRHLRLLWPRQAGFPEVRSIVVELEPAHPIRTPPQRPECDDGATPTCLLELPGEGAQRLEVVVRAAGRVGIRLTKSWAGGWRPAAEEVVHWSEERDSRTRILPLDGAGPGSLRLELHGEGGAAPVLEGYVTEYRPRAVGFVAATPGDYTLAYGDGRQTGQPAERGGGGGGEETAWIELGPETEHPWPPLPPIAAELAGPVPQIDWAAAWPVRSEAPAGTVVRLALPDAALRASGGPGSGARLDHGGRQVPYVVRTPPVPAVAQGSGRYSPAPLDAQGGSLSGVDLDLARGALLIRQIELTAPGGPFHRRLRFGVLEDPTVGAPTEPADRTPWSIWRCEPKGPLPCRAVIEPGPGLPGDRLRVEIDDGDNPPLEELRITFWRQRPELIFVWPGGDVTLRVAESIGPPRYDLVLVAGELLARPWTEATVDLDAAGGQDPDGRLARAALLAALALAVVVLLVFLARLLRQPGSG